MTNERVRLVTDLLSAKYLETVGDDSDAFDNLTAARAALLAAWEAEVQAARGNRMFPIQSERGAQPHPTQIPWSVADRAYSVYRAKYGSEQSLERLAERGGFGPGEMDIFLPGWREEVSEINRLKGLLKSAMVFAKVVEDLQAENAELALERDEHAKHRIYAENCRDALRIEVERLEDHADDYWKAKCLAETQSRQSTDAQEQLSVQWDSAVAECSRLRTKVEALEALVRAADNALVWASGKSPEAARGMVEESVSWRIRARRVLGGEEAK